MNRLSIVVATYNEEENIGRCLESVKSIADEIIVIDALSGDKTVSIAKKFTSNIFSIKNQPMFHANKQYGLNKATGQWILQLDADEVISNSLKHEIIKTLKQNKNPVSGYYIPRKNYFLGHLMKKGGLYPDFVIRFFKRGKGYFPQKSVHEQIIISGEVGYLDNPILHYPYNSVTEYLIKADRYTSLTSQEIKDHDIPITVGNTIKYCLLIPFSTFISIYFRHLGLMDGFYGFVWAFLSSTHYFFAYSKLINNKK